MKTIEHIERVYSTKPARYIVGAIEFLFAWCLVAVVVGSVLVYFFSPPRGTERAFIFGWDWRNLPGAVLGLLAGFQAFRISVRRPRVESLSTSSTSSFQAAGGLQGLRMRVARNRIIALSAFSLLILFSALFIYLHRH